jgi:hypothetical protein
MSRKLLPLLLLAGCAKSGMSEATRTDVTMRMESVRPTITKCYADQLKLDRKLRGMLVVTFEAAPKTGQFEKVAVVRNDMNDAQIATCMVDAVSTLKLETPQKTKLSVTYPLDFAPTK